MTGFRTDPVRVRVPASSANLGPGFDALAIALALHDEVTARVTGGGLRVEVAGEGAGAVATDERSLLVRAARAGFDRIGRQPPGLALRARNGVPHGRGLGSSAAAIVAGICIARALVPDEADRLADEAVLALASEIEGHPDNVAACLLGGLTVSWRDGDGARAVRLAVLPVVRPVLAVAPGGSSTLEARRRLPATVPHSDAAHAAGRAALLVAALTRRPDLLLPATEDRLHQPYRGPLHPATAALVTALRGVGVPAVVSGAGPTVLAFGHLATVAAHAPAGWTVRAVAVDPSGARLLAADGG